MLTLSSFLFLEYFGTNSKISMKSLTQKYFKAELELSESNYFNQQSL